MADCLVGPPTGHLTGESNEPPLHADYEFQSFLAALALMILRFGQQRELLKRSLGWSLDHELLH